MRVCVKKLWVSMLFILMLLAISGCVVIEASASECSHRNAIRCTEDDFFCDFYMISDTEHVRYQYSTIFCKDCYYSRDDQVCITEEHNFDSNMKCQQCYYQRNVPCNHLSNSKEWIEKVSFASESECKMVNHQITTCDDCGEVHAKIEYWFEGDHFIDEGKCYYCGYRQKLKCEHMDFFYIDAKCEYFVLDKSYPYSSATHHGYREEWIAVCKDCGKTNTRMGIYFLSHEFINGVCSECGYGNPYPIIKNLSLSSNPFDMGKPVSVSGIVDGNGGTVARVRVSVFYNEALTSGKVYKDYEINRATFDLSNVEAIVPGETLAQDGTLLIPDAGNYWLAVYATNTNEKGQGTSPALYKFTVNKPVSSHESTTNQSVDGVSKPIKITGLSVSANPAAIGEPMSVSGIVDGNGGTVARVRVSVFYNEMLIGGKVYRDYDVNSATFDLSNVEAIVPGETLAQDGTLLIPDAGKYWLAVYATNMNEKGQGALLGLYEFTVTNQDCAHKYTSDSWVDGVSKSIRITDNKDGKTHTHVYSVRRTCNDCNTDLGMVNETIPNEKHRLTDGRCTCGYTDKSITNNDTNSYTYNVYYKFHVDDAVQPANGIIEVPYGVTNMHVYLGTDEKNLLHPSVNTEYTYELYGGDTSILSLSPNSFNIGIKKNGCTNLIIRKDGKIAARADVVVGDNYIYGCQLGYHRSDDLYYKGTEYTFNARLAFANPNMTIEMKQLWFELSLGMHTVPTFAYEDYNDAWLYHQANKVVRSWYIFSKDITGNLWDACVGTFDNAVAAYDWIMTSTEMGNTDGLARSDKFAMAQVMIDGWLEEINQGTLSVSDPTLLKKLRTYEARVRALDASADEREIINLLKEIVGVFTLYSNTNAIVDVCTGILDTAPGAIEAVKSTILLEIECCKAQIVKDVLMQQSLTEGLDPDIKEAVDKLIKVSSEMWIKSLKSKIDTGNKVIGTIVGTTVGGNLAYTTGGLSVAAQMTYNGIISLGFDIISDGDEKAMWKYITETDKYTETLEGAIKVYLARTKPQLIKALNTFREDPSLKNYKALNNENYSGKLQMWGIQSEQLSKLYYTIAGLGTCGDENYYYSTFESEKSSIWSYVFQIDKGLCLDNY